jgi:two-component system response regulator ChvI
LKSSIAIIDDDENIVASLVIALELHGYRVRAYHDGLTGLLSIEGDPPDLLILDMKMPIIDGLDVLRRFRRSSSIPVMILSSKSEEVDEALGFSFGADDYVRKPFSQALLIERVKALLWRASNPRRSTSFDNTPSPKRIQRGDLVLDPEKQLCLWRGRLVRLSYREFLIVASLAARPNLTKSRETLVAETYRDANDVDIRNIDSHMKRIRIKFRGVDPSFRAIETRYGEGYVLTA